MIVEWVWFTIVTYLVGNFLASAYYDLTREHRHRVGPKWSVFFFPLYKERCEQHYYDKN